MRFEGQCRLKNPNENTPKRSGVRRSCLVLVDSEMEFFSHTRIAYLLVGEGTVCTHLIFWLRFRGEVQMSASVKRRLS